MYQNYNYERHAYQQILSKKYQIMAVLFVVLLSGCQSNINAQDSKSDTIQTSQVTVTEKKLDTDTDNIGKNTMTIESTKPRLILVHGLHQSPFIMKPLAKKLTKAGFDVYSFKYPTLSAPLSAHSQNLNQWLIDNHDGTQPIHMVGHSLGGLVIRDFIGRYPNWKVDKVVNLGTPNLGSVSADYTKKIAPFMVGKAYKDGLDGTVADIPKSVTLGVIAGNKPFGIGTPFLSYHNQKYKLSDKNKPNDGTVYVSETRLPSASAHIIMPVTHTGMLTNKAVARQTIHFLQNGTFTE